MAPYTPPPTFTVESAQLIFKNFAGHEDKYNREGDRNFSVILDTDAATQMEADGWNVKWLDPRDEGDEATPYIQVAVSFKNKPPRIVVISSGGHTPFSEPMVETLDYLEMENVDLICTGYRWEMSDGKSGTKAYLKTMFVTQREDELEKKYAHILSDNEAIDEYDPDEE